MSRFIIATVLFLSLVLSISSKAIDIASSGFNEDVVMESGTSRYAHRLDIFGACYIANGLSGGSGVGIGLPTSLSYTSATSSGVVYHLQPFNQNNVLRMGDNDPMTGTMTVVSGKYSQLHILAASGSDGSDWPSALGQTSDIILNFSDGSVTLSKALLAYDWDASVSGAPTSAIAIGGMDRNYIGTSGSSISLQISHDFAMYETTLNLANLGYSDRILQSITFSTPSSHQGTGIFAIDGVVVPEPSSLAFMSLASLGLLRRRTHSRA
jgi:hypothetical protein